MAVSMVPSIHRAPPQLGIPESSVVLPHKVKPLPVRWFIVVVSFVVLLVLFSCFTVFLGFF